MRHVDRATVIVNLPIELMGRESSILSKLGDMIDEIRSCITEIRKLFRSRTRVCRLNCLFFALPFERKPGNHFGRDGVRDDLERIFGNYEA